MADEIGDVQGVDRLRNMLFEAAKLLKEKKIGPEEAKAFAELGQTMINTAKVEMDFMRLTKQQIPTRFFPQGQAKQLPDADK